LPAYGFIVNLSLTNNSKLWRLPVTRWVVIPPKIDFTNYLKTRLYYPYPFYYSSFKSIAGMAAIFTIAVFLFNYIIEPFSYNYDEHRFSFLVISLFNGLLVGIVLMAFLLLLRISIPNSFRDKAWTIGKEILLWISLLLLIGIANFFLRELIYDNPNNFSFKYLVTEIVNTFIIGSLFATVAVMANYIHLLRSSTEKALKWNELIENSRHLDTVESQITITGPSQQDAIVFQSSNFLFAKSDGNYVELTIQNENGAIQRRIIRNTLSNVEEQFQGYNAILKVHRSFIVNLQHIQSVKGNAQGYKLTLNGTKTRVPVSRANISALDKALHE
jgi:hypothetical protein